MNSESIARAFARISRIMADNEMYLVELDRQNGDGDLGLYMKSGFEAVENALQSSEEKDLGRLFMLISRTMNENAPSSLGTILSVAFAGMAKTLKGKENATLSEITLAMETGVEKIMEKTGSKPGEKTVLDSVCPAIAALKDSDLPDEKRLALAAKAAAEGSESTRDMRSVHGRAAYYGDKSIGVLDGGSVVGKLLFEALAGKN